jgi:hypothetical protein
MIQPRRVREVPVGWPTVTFAKLNPSIVGPTELLSAFKKERAQPGGDALEEVRKVSGVVGATSDKLLHSCSPQCTSSWWSDAGDPIRAFPGNCVKSITSPRADDETAKRCGQKQQGGQVRRPKSKKTTIEKMAASSQSETERIGVRPNYP